MEVGRYCFVEQTFRLSLGSISCFGQTLWFVNV